MTRALDFRLRGAPAAALLVLLCLGLTGCGSWKRFLYDGFGRDDWQKPDEVVASLDLRAGDHVADLGSGGGFFTFRLAEAVGQSGRVYAIDVDEALLEYIAGEAEERDLTWIQTVVSPGDHPGVPDGSVDLVFVSNVFHHLPDPGTYFANARSVLRSGGRVAIVELAEEGWFGGHATQADEVASTMADAGYRRIAVHDFLERQSFQVFEPTRR